jgi:molecular chaperone DnaK (HSP70)
MIFYILDATQLQINDDKMFFKMAKKAIEKGGKEAHDRFIFILNKADEFDPEKGELITKVIKKVKEYLKKNGIENPTIIPVSALLTKLIRMNWEGEYLARSDRNNLNALIDLFVEEDEMNLLECSREFISKRIYDKLNNELQKHKDAGDDEKAAEILSGIPVVEALLDEFIEKHAVPAKIKDATDSFREVLDFNEKITELEKILQELKKFAEDIEKVPLIYLINQEILNKNLLLTQNDFKIKWLKKFQADLDKILEI